MNPAIKAKDAKRRTSDMEQRDKKRHELNNSRVKILRSIIPGNVRFEDVDVVDQHLEDEAKTKKKKTHKPLRVMKLKNERKDNMKHGKDEDNQVIDKEDFHTDDTDGKMKKKSKEKRGDEKRGDEKRGDEKRGDEKLFPDSAKNNVESPIIGRRPIIGLFKDSKRRIDLVIVIEDDPVPQLQVLSTRFLTNVIKTGLELEFEAGVMEQHKNLIFVKVHAPDKVLEDFGDTFGMKKYFKKHHLEFVKQNSSTHEREWLKLVRRQYVQPLQYSNLERSYIVYMVLRHLRFGKANNFYSLTRLLNNNIILDAYALHDGPYFFHPQQNSAYINARQILFYNWVGFINIFTFQPLNLINEYFGQKIGFYFAFYQFYNKVLIIPMVLGIGVSIYQLFKFNLNQKDPNLPYPEFLISRESDIACKPIGQNQAQFDEFYICPKCRDFNVCPFLKLKSYCKSVYYKSFLDSRLAFYHSFMICILVILFIRFWKRTENYWIWMWELGHLKRPIIRSEFDEPLEKPSRSEYTGIWMHRDGPITNKLRYLVSNLLMFLCGLGFVAYSSFLLWFHHYLLKKFTDKLIERDIHPEYVIIVLVGILSTIMVFICVEICWYISYEATNYENHRTHEKFEGSFILKVFGCSFVFTLAILIYTALIKGLLYFTPIENYSPVLNITILGLPTSWKADWLGDLFITNCGYYGGCWDEVALYYTVIMFVKMVILRIPWYYYNSRRLQTDYNRGKDINKKVPSWEREYMLEPITETQMVLKINALMIQIALLALFGFINSWVTLMVFITNMWDIRNEARVMLLGCRRPLLFRCVGLGKWIYVLYFICYASAFTMSLMLVKSSSQVERYVEDILTIYDLSNVNNNTVPTLLLNKRFYKFETRHYDEVRSAIKSLSEYKKDKPAVCHFGVNTMKKIDKKNPVSLEYHGDLEAHVNAYKKLYYKGVIFLTYIHLALIILLLVMYNISTTDKTTKEIMEMERNLLRVHLQNIEVDEKRP